MLLGENWCWSLLGFIWKGWNSAYLVVMYVPFEITDSGKFSFLECEKASSGLNLFFPDIWSTLSSNFLIVLFCFSHWSRSFASSCEDKTNSSEILGLFSPSGNIAFTPCFATWSTFRRSHYFSLSHSLLFLYIYSNQMYSGMGAFPSFLSPLPWFNSSHAQTKMAGVR